VPLRENRRVIDASRPATGDDRVAGLRDAVEALGGQADRRAAEIEELRRLPADLSSALVDTGLGRAWAPARYGGLELPVLELLDALEALAAFEAGTAWCGMIAATTSLLGGYLPERWAEEIYGDPRAITGGHAAPQGRARPVEGGLLVSGHWQWGSGSFHCTWIGGGTVVVDEDGAPAPRADDLRAPFVLFAPDQVELLDTWYTMGLRGSGSTDYEVHDAFVPEGRWTEIVGQEPVAGGPLYRFPFFGALALGVCSISLGLARRALDEVVELAEGKRYAMSTRPMATRAVVQAEVARAEAQHRSARAFVRDTVAEAWAAACAGHPLGTEHRRLLRLAATNATTQSVAAVDSLYRLAGGTAVYESSPLERLLRDVNVAGQHAMVAPRTYELVGRMALGQSTDIAQL
jgi:alkylation response protein AidB-like acyl-CoA dehydrogenase